MKVSILTENMVYKRGFLGEHGLSMLLETGGKRYLFDMGQSDVFLRNADKMKIDLGHLDGIILSHGHYDHCGGMRYWARKQKTSGSGRQGVPIYINKKAFDKKYSEHPVTGEMLFSGIYEEAEAWMQESGELVYPEDGCVAVAENIYLLSQISFVTDFESVPARFWKAVQLENDRETAIRKDNHRKVDSLEKDYPIGEDSRTDSLKNHLTADSMEDEQILVVREEQGLCVFAGCAHPGIINCLNYVQSCFPGEHIHSLVAGMHLKGCTSKQLQKTIQSIKELGIDVVVPMHCTGMIAIAAIKEALEERCVLAEVGKKIVL